MQKRQKRVATRDAYRVANQLRMTSRELLNQNVKRTSWFWISDLFYINIWSCPHRRSMGRKHNTGKVMEYQEREGKDQGVEHWE